MLTPLELHASVIPFSRERILSEALTSRTRAEKSATAMWEGDSASQWFGFEIESVDEGSAELSLTVAAHHCNGHGSCHGGVIFALADSAFAFACNSRNRVTVAQQNQITYLVPGKNGDCLRARAEERALSGRSGIYDVTVTNQDAVVIAEMRGLSRTISGQLFDEGTQS